MDTLLTNNLNNLLSLQQNDKYILRDKHLGLALEITNLLFKDLNQINDNDYITSIVGVNLPEGKYTYQPTQISNVITLDKNDNKQKKVVMLFTTTSNKMINFINNLTLSDDLIDDIINN